MPASVTAQYETSTASASTSSISFQLSLVNTGTSAIPLSGLTARHWFTEDGGQPLQFACDYAPPGCASITGSLAAVSPPVTGVDHYRRSASVPARDHWRPAPVPAVSRSGSTRPATPA